jgi:hypothetical protein
MIYMPIWLTPSLSINKPVLAGHLILSGFEPYGIMFTNLCVITVVMVMMLRNSGPYGV